MTTKTLQAYNLFGEFFKVMHLTQLDVFEDDVTSFDVT